jgi:hypothetical protein
MRKAKIIFLILFLYPEYFRAISKNNFQPPECKPLRQIFWLHPLNLGKFLATPIHAVLFLFISYRDVLFINMIRRN